MKATQVLTREDRARHVAQMNANNAIEDFHPDREDRELQQQYIDGSKTLDDLLTHARQFAHTHAPKT